ncbi:hypothetical protein KEM56_006513 [Ascosphaera pollenicola]|nr:hypothetical protein KEM56_006513 [Ascosphaera pollenicola]
MNMYNANAHSHSHPTHRHRASSNAAANAVATEHNRSPWLDPFFYGEGIADEKSRQEKAAAAAAAAAQSRRNRQHSSSSSSTFGTHGQGTHGHGSQGQGSPAAFASTPEAAEAIEAGTAARYFGDDSRTSSMYRSKSKWEPAKGNKVLDMGLVSFAKNGWETGYTPHGPYYHGGAGGGGGGRGFLTSFIRSPRRLFRPRTVLWLTVLIVLWFTYSKMIGTFRWYQEEHSILKSLDWRNKERVGGWFGSNKIPEFPDLVYMKELDGNLVPAPRPAGPEQGSSKRLVIVGDVHGCLEELQELLNNIDFSPKNNDHLIFTGGIIGGGPKSPGTVDLARTVSASCVRGYAEDRVLLTRNRMQATEKMIKAEKEHDSGTVKLAVLLGEEPGVVGERELAERQVAKELSDEQADWLAACPVILKVGRIGADGVDEGDEGQDMGDVVVVHGGLIPGVALDHQDPAAVMTVRTIDTELHVPYDSAGGIDWARMFDKEQQILAAAASRARNDPVTLRGIRQPMTVVYGHDLLDTPSIRRYTKGLNTACYLGGRLSALIIEDGGVTSVVGVDCPDRGGDDDDGSSSYSGGHGKSKRDEGREVHLARKWFSF